MHRGDDMGIAGRQFEMIQFADAVPHGGPTITVRSGFDLRMRASAACQYSCTNSYVNLEAGSLRISKSTVAAGSCCVQL